MSETISWRSSAAGCGAFVSAGAGGAPRECSAAVTHTGLRLYEHPVEVWQAFACAQHAGHLRAARQLLDRDRAVLEDRRARVQRALEGKSWDRPGPLAVGAAARELVRRAEAAAE